MKSLAATLVAGFAVAISGHSMQNAAAALRPQPNPLVLLDKKVYIFSNRKKEPRGGGNACLRP